MSRQVLQAIQIHLEIESERGGYVAAEQVQSRLQACRQNMASLLNCSAPEIALTDSASRAWHRILNCFDFQAGDVVLVSPTVWGGNYFSLLQLQRRLGIQVECMPCAEDGSIDIDRLKHRLTPKVRLMELTLAASGWDVWQPAQAIAELARLHGVPLAIDASQAVGQREIDVAALDCDFLFASGRKWLSGPRGTGVLYVNQFTASHLCPLGLDQHTGFLENGQLDWLDDARRFELSECCIAGHLGLGVALEEKIRQLQDGQASMLKKLASEYRQSLAEIPGVQLPACEGDFGAIVTFRHTYKSPAMIRDYLRQHQVEVGVHPRSYMPLHPPTQLLGDCVRISPYTATALGALSHFTDKLLDL